MPRGCAESNSTSLAGRAFGAQGAAATAFAPAMSAGGRFVAFSSLAPKLDRTDIDVVVDIFVRDRQAGTTILVSRATGTGSPRLTSRCGRRQGTMVVPPGSGLVVSVHGSDVIVGSHAVDLIQAFGGSDLVCGRGDADHISGGTGNDRVWGGQGDDSILGGRQNDRIDGGPGNDLLDGGPGRDRVLGGPGNDVVSTADGFADIVDCGRGNDRVIADALDRVRRCERRRVIGTAASPPLAAR